MLKHIFQMNAVLFVEDFGDKDSNEPCDNYADTEF